MTRLKQVLLLVALLLSQSAVSQASTISKSFEATFFGGGAISGMFTGLPRGDTELELSELSSLEVEWTDLPSVGIAAGSFSFPGDSLVQGNFFWFDFTVGSIPLLAIDSLPATQLTANQLGSLGIALVPDDSSFSVVMGFAGTQSFNRIGIDNPTTISITDRVPEPSSLISLTFFSVVGLIRRRR